MPSDLRVRIEKIIRVAYFETGFDSPEELRYVLEKLILDAASHPKLKHKVVAKDSKR